MSIQIARLLELIEYVQQTAVQRASGSAGASNQNRFRMFDHQAGAADGVRVAVQGADSDEPVWLSVGRPANPQLPPKAESPWLWPWLEIGDAMLATPTLAVSVRGDSLIAAGTHRDARSGESEGGALPAPTVERDAIVPLESYEHRAEVERQLAAYLRSQWQPWAEAEQARRRRSRVYMQFISLHQELTGPGSDGQLELLWGVGLIPPGGDEKADLRPLIVHAVDLALEPQTGAAHIRPRSAYPRLELEGVRGLDRTLAAKAERLAAEFFATAEEPFSPFDPPSYAGALRIAQEACGGLLPEVRAGWILFARPRTVTPLVQDLERFAAVLRTADADAILPPAVAALVSDPAAEVPAADLPIYRGISNQAARSADAPARDLYFPLPFNEEQMRVVQLLESRDGVIVQGPPGTGKTHTIANILCHWLSNGRRVLVTSMKEPALAVLREKLPEEIQPLALALLAGDQGGLHALENAIQTIAAEVQRLDPSAEGSAIERLQENIDALQARLVQIDGEMASVAQRQLAPVMLDGESIDPLDAASLVAARDSDSSWLPDSLGTDERFSPRFDEADLGQLFRARAALGADLVHTVVPIPAPDTLPPVEALLDAHRRLVRLAQLSADGRTSDTPILAVTDADTHATLVQAAALTERVRTLRSELADADAPWMAAHAAKIVEVPEAVQALESIAGDLDDIGRTHAAIVARPVSLPPGAEFDSDLAQAVRNLANGRRAFGLATLFRPEARHRLAALTIDDHLPVNADDWMHVSHALALRVRWRPLCAKWNAIAAVLALPAVSQDAMPGITEAGHILSSARKLRSLREAEQQLADQAQKLFPGWSLVRRLREEPAAIRGLERAIDHYLNAQQLADVWEVRSRLREVTGSGAAGVFEDLRRFTGEELGNPEIADNALVERWFVLCSEFKRLHGLADEFARIASVTAAIEDSGAAKLAALLRQPSDLPRESLVPDNWRDTWRIRRLATQLRAVSAGPRVLELSAQRTEIEHDLTRAYRELVVRRSWLRLTEQATPGVRAALQAYLSAVQRLGKGTGKRAARYRQDARDAAAAANAAVPCWIMPHHRISESLPSQFGAFDLVVIDEASQSDLSALPALLRGAKFLVVGDDKQVSPDPVGLDEDRIRAMMQRHLANQVPLYRSQMSPERSIYDLARVAFAANGVMLKEHFRCIAPIIEFSKREFYGDELRPLRLPVRSRRLDPPLVDVLIEGASRTGDLNAAEIEFIVSEIGRIAADSRTRGRSIGVVSLLGEEQAVRIWELAADRLGPAVLQEHALVCGDAKALQGRERDIVFLSMVVAPNDLGGPLARDTFAQRFNVAASRARERMVLVRSVKPEHLPDSDRLRLGLIAHFRQPFAAGPSLEVPARERCESMLERALFDWLVARGYRVTPRVQVGAWTIDLVVEGTGDNRIAIECDGDRHVGAAYWLDDVRRQRVLERTGWNFWRCFATRFVLERDAVLAELEAVLASRGIRPLRGGEPERFSLTEHRVLRVSSPEGPHRPAAAAAGAGRSDPARALRTP
ncbi:MAG: AAA family ATPase [Betaproteobacteria bacterium]|nr:AAA family ATPase [Betaproteobacteria bacterium]